MTPGGTYSVTVTVTASGGGVSDSQSFQWTITHILIAQPQPQVNAAGDTVALSVAATDPDGDSLTFSAGGLRRS